jgi:hypothetical protein
LSIRVEMLEIPEVEVISQSKYENLKDKNSEVGGI